jgi:hypothetical protein
MSLDFEIVQLLPATNCSVWGSHADLDGKIKFEELLIIGWAMGSRQHMGVGFSSFSLRCHPESQPRFLRMAVRDLLFALFLPLLLLRRLYFA